MMNSEVVNQLPILQSASELGSAEVRTFCMTLAYTGCRMSEALMHTVDHVDLSATVVRFLTLKQRGKIIYRSAPVPNAYDAVRAGAEIGLLHDFMASKERSLIPVYPMNRLCLEATGCFGMRA